MGAIFVLRDDAPDLYEGLTSGGGLACVIGSAIAGLATLALVWARRFAAARWSAAAAVAAVTVGWAFAQSPDILPGELTLEEAAAPDATLVAVLISVGLGAVVLVPSLYLLYSLVLRGRLDQGYEPLDQQFRPITASDAEADK